MFRVSENVRNRESTLTATWMLMCAGKVGGAPGQWTPVDILFRSGLWQPMPFDARSQKLAGDQALGPNQSGGFGRLISSRSQNVILDLGSNDYRGANGGFPDVGLAESGAVSSRPQYDYNHFIAAPYGAYIEFRASVYALTAGNHWVHYPLVQKQTGKGFRQKMHDPYNQYCLSGYIIRVGIPAAGVPTIKYIGSMPVVPVGEAIVKTYPIGNLMGAVLIQTEFQQRYVPATPDNSNPVKQPPGTPKPSNNKPQTQEEVDLDKAGRIAQIAVPGTITDINNVDLDAAEAATRRAPR
jgi:hypothetical protein